jgi:sensor histidine kinase regulating citrate/malate metabolism
MTIAFKLQRLLLTSFSIFPLVSFSETDQRQTLDLSPEQRMHVLQEMQALLAGIQSIVAALGNNDMKAVAESARPRGMVMARNASGHLQGALPMEFMQLGQSVHRDFDQIATDAESMGDPKLTLQQLGETMNKCVACHATYQIGASATQQSGHDKMQEHKH